MLMVK